MEELKVIFPIVRHHHERFDGHGYPAGLAGEDIPLGSRIVAIADALDAMSSLRTYVEPLSLPEAATAIQEASGTQFDPQLVELFLPIAKSQPVQEALSSPLWAKGYSDQHAACLI